jgi:phosphoesterase RecJ-like protein
MSTYDEALTQAASFIRGHDHFLIISHVSPDGDALGSTFAMAALLDAMDKKFLLLNEDPLPDKFNFLPYANQLKRSKAVDPKGKTILALDAADRGRLGEIEKRLDSSNTIVNIDHHPTNDRYGHLNVVRAEAAATAEVIYDLVQVLGIPVNRDMATALYAGMLTDTGGFRYSNTSAVLLEKAAHLISSGASPSVLSDRLLETLTIGHVKLLKRALEKMRFIQSEKICLISITQADLAESHAVPEDVDGIVSLPRSIEGVEVGVVLKEKSNEEIKVSLRSRQQVDVSKVALQFGGGGHKRAAGFTIHGSLEQAERTVIGALAKLMSEGP